MTTLRYFSMLAALSLAGAAYAQTQATPDQTNSQSSSSSTYSGTGSTSTQNEGSMGSQSSRDSQESMGSQGSTSSQGSMGSQTNPGANPAAASSPHQREATKQSEPEAAPGGNASSANATSASSPHQRHATRMAEAGSGGEISNGMPVQTRSGESLGTVVSVVPGSSGNTQNGYVVIGESSGGGGNATPVPYSAAASHVQNGKLVMERSRLDKAPKIQQSEMQDSSNTSWQRKVDSYWGKGHHGMGADRMRSGSSSETESSGTSSSRSGTSDHNRSTNPDNPDQMTPRP
jgi:hypothetical protein